jgi:uncharacterized membrane protein YfcA
MLDYFLLVASGFVAWIVSTVGGGGGATLLVPLVGFIAGAQAVAPVTTVATLIAGGGRAFVFWKDIDWSVVAWGLPGAAIGALLGAALFSKAPAEWLQIFVGLFLISTVLQYRFGEKERTFKAQKWWFFPVEIVIGFLSGLIGAMDPIMNTLYLNAGVTKGADGWHQDGNLAADASRENRYLYDAWGDVRTAVAVRTCRRNRRARLELVGKAAPEGHG